MRIKSKQLTVANQNEVSNYKAQILFKQIMKFKHKLEIIHCQKQMNSLISIQSSNSFVLLAALSLSTF